MTRHIDAEGLAGHLLGESTAESAAAVERHLAACTACRARESELRHMIAMFAGATAPRPRADRLDALLAAQLRLGRSRRRRALRGGLWAAGTVAAVLGIFAAGFWAGRRVSPGPLAAGSVPLAGEVVDRSGEHDLAAPRVTFVAAVPDRVAGLAGRDTTTN